MPRTRVVLGYSEAGNLAKPRLVYAGLSGGEAESAMVADTDSLRFEILEGPGRRKNNPKFKPRTEPAADLLPPVESQVQSAAPRGRGK